MAALIESGRVVDLILVLTLAEALVLALLHRRTGRGVRPADLLPNLLAGAALLLALRAALAAAGWGSIAALLALAGVAHGFDLRRRWR